MANYNQSKVYLNLTGVIAGLDGKEPYETAYKKSLGFAVKTSKENSIYVSVGNWKNATLSVKVKAEGSDEVETMTEQDAVDTLQMLFKNGDVVRVGLRGDANTYSSRLDYFVTSIYTSSKEINFEDENFEEENELVANVVTSGVCAGGVQPALFVPYKSKGHENDADLEQGLVVKDADIEEYLKTVPVGSEMKFIMRVVNEPVYEVVGDDKNSKDESRTTFKGKKVGGSKFQKRKIVDTIKYLEIVDIDVKKCEIGKYKMEDVQLESEDDGDIPF